MRFIFVGVIGFFIGSIPTFWGLFMAAPSIQLQAMSLVIEGEGVCSDNSVEFQIVIENQQEYAVTIIDGTPKLSGTFSIPAHGNQELNWRLYYVPDPVVTFSFSGIWKDDNGFPVGQGGSTKSITLTSKNCPKFFQDTTS